jgi:hypothetical protein
MKMPSLLRTHALVAVPGALLVLAVLMQGQPAQGQPARARVDLRCEARGLGPRLDCLLRVQRPDGTPMEGAALTLGASMPSMPLAHSVPRVAARPSGKTGEYAVSLELEMSGVWALEIDLSAPVRERIVRVVRAQECEKTDPCPVPDVRRGGSSSLNPDARSGSKAGGLHKN